MIKQKEYVAYKGEFFTIEWYYDENGKSKVLDYYSKLNDVQRRKVFYLFKRIADSGKISNKILFVNEGDNIYAFKPQPNRFLSFFFKGKKIIVTNAFLKKTPKIPKNEKTKALKSYENYLKRIKEGTYYEK